MQSQADGVAWRVRNEIILAVRFHDLAVLVLVREDVIAESGTGKTVVEVCGESVRDTAAQAQFHAIAVHLSSVGDHAPAAVLGKAGELEVADVHVEEGIEYLRSLNQQFKIEDSNKITCGEQILDYLRKLKVYLDTNAPGKKIIAAIDSISDIQFADPIFAKMNDKQKGDYIAINVKKWTVELDIPILGSIHLRKIEQNRRPTIADLKDSGRYVYEASWVGLVYNDVSRNKQSATIYSTSENGEKMPIIELDWAKNKKSSFKGKTYHYFEPNYSLVTECSQEACKRFDALIYTN